MLLIIAGNVKLENAKILADSYFSCISSGIAIASRPEPKIPKKKNIIEKSKKFKQAYLMVGYPVPSIAKDDYFALKVLNSLLGGRMTGRLFVELREKLSLAYVVNSAYPSRKHTSKFIIYIGLEAKNVKLAEKRISEMLDEIKSKPVPAAELEETKNYIRGISLLDRQTIGRRAWYAGWWETMGLGADYDKEFLDNLMAVTSKDIQKAAKKYFNRNKVTVKVVPASSPAKIKNK